MITILGLGPGDAALLTRQAWNLLQSARVLYLRTAIHPTVAELPAHLELRPFDALYESAGAFGEVYEQIAADLVARAAEGEDVLYAVPGHPLVAEATTRRLLALAGEHAIDVRVVAGLSFVEPVCAALALDPLEHGLQLLDALDLAPRDEWRVTSDGLDAPDTRHPTPDTRHSDGAWSEIQGIGPYTPPLLPYPLAATRPALICQVYNRRVASDAKLSLMERYPADHPVTLVRAAGVAGQEHVWTVPLHELDHQDALDHLTCAYLPPLAPLADLRSPEGAAYVVARLLGPGGCPWDREQTHQSIRKDLLEETYEALEALDAGDMDALAEELGDVLLHVLMHGEMARQAGDFDLGDVYRHIAAKLIRRHPHVFGGAWDLDDQQWPWDKLREEIDEIRAAANDEAHADASARTGRLEEEFGDLLLAAAKLGYWLHVDAESALRAAIAKFRRRFAQIERELQMQGRDLAALTTAEKEALWRRVKDEGLGVRG